MSYFFIIIIAIAMVATLGVMAIGVFSMVKGGEFNKKYGNRLMQARVVLQGLALAMIVLMFLSSGQI